MGTICGVKQFEDDALSQLYSQPHNLLNGLSNDSAVRMQKAVIKNRPTLIAVNRGLETNLTEKFSSRTPSLSSQPIVSSEVCQLTTHFDQFASISAILK